VRATADQVRQLTGFAIGGVPPIGHTHRLETFVDRDLLRLDTVWAAAGTPRAVFAIDPHELVRITDGRVEDVAQAT
jgi:prolyl-tRNA editing enzyme YbaK/EbsC (Cys-tRNA(Pro) deacylase)